MYYVFINELKTRWLEYMLYLKQPPIPYTQGQTETLLWGFKQNKPTVKSFTNFRSSPGLAFEYSTLVRCISPPGIYTKII